MIQSVKAGLSESLIIRTMQRENKPANLTTADLVKLKNAGVSENIIGVMLDPGSAPAPSAAPAPAAALPRLRPGARAGAGRGLRAPAWTAHRRTAPGPEEARDRG